MKKFCNSKNVKKSAVTAHFKRGLALAVAASVALTGADFTSMAVSDQAEIDPIEIAGFEDLAEEVAYQQLEVGASEADIVLPNTLRATKSIKEDNIIDEVDEEVSETPEDSQDDSSEDNGSESSDNNAELNEVPVEVIEEETPAEDSQEEEITVEEENIVARIIGGLFKNVFDSFSTTAYAADSEDITITGVEWSLSEELSDRAEFKADEQWLRYVYVPEIPSCYVTDATLPNITVDIIGGEVLGEVRVSDEAEEEELGILEDSEFEDGDAEFEAEETTPTTPALPDENTAYEYTLTANADPVTVLDLLKTTTFEGASLPIVSEKLAESVVITNAEVKTEDAEFLVLTSSTTGGVTEYKLSTPKAFAEPKELKVTVKENKDVEDAKAKTYTIKVTADAPTSAGVDISLKDTASYVYSRKKQTLKADDVVVKVGTGDSAATLILGTDYEVTPVSGTDAGTYDFTVTFKSDAYKNLVKATGKWIISPVEVKLTADNKASVVNGELQPASYKVEPVDTQYADNFKNVHSNHIEGFTVSYTPNPDVTKEGVYDIVNSYELNNTNYTVKTDAVVNTANYIVIGPLKIVIAVGSTIYESGCKLTKGTSYYGRLKSISATKNDYRISAFSQTCTYKNTTTGQIIAVQDADKTEGLPNEVGNYTVSLEYKLSKVLVPQTQEYVVYSTKAIPIDAIPYEIVDSKTKITDSSVKLNKTSFTYNGKDQGPTVTVTVNNVKLVENTDYTVTGDEELDADDYEVTVTGKGNYEGTVTKSWKINKASIANATIPSGTTTSYSYKGSAITHETPETIKLSGFSDALESDVDFEVDTSKSTVSATKAGTYTVYLKGINNFTGTKSYTWKITSSSNSSSTTGKATSSVNFSNPDNVTSGVSNVSSSALSSYATSKKATDKTTTYTLNVKPISKSTLNSVELNAIAEYGDDSVVTTDSLNITVHRTVKDSEGNVEVDEDVSDLGASIDVACYIGTSNASKTINIIREHNGQIKKFDKLSARASSAPKDGTYYVDKTNGRVYIYSQYFSHFTLIYTATDAVVKTSRTGTASSSSSSSDPDALGARAPQTGDNLPVVWVWVIVLLAGVALIGFSAFELKRFKRGDFKKKR